MTKNIVKSRQTNTCVPVIGASQPLYKKKTLNNKLEMMASVTPSFRLVAGVGLTRLIVVVGKIGVENWAFGQNYIIMDNQNFV